jgi:hypothetical protein
MQLLDGHRHFGKTLHVLQQTQRRSRLDAPPILQLPLLD